LSANQHGLIRRLLLSGVLLIPALAIVVYQTWRGWDQLVSYQWELDPKHWAFGFLGYSISLVFLLIAWNYLMGRLGGVKQFRTNSRLYLVSGLSKRLPGCIWYMTSRTLLYQEEGVPAPVSLAGSALELTLMATSGVVTYFLTLPFAGDFLQGGLRIVVGIALLLVGATILQPAVFNRIFGFFLRLMGSQTRVEVSYRDILPVMPLYLAAWAIGGAWLYAMISSVYQLPLETLPTIMNIWAATGTLTMLLSAILFGVGTREVALSLFLGFVIPQPIAIIVTILFGLMMTVGEFVWVGIFLLWK
jgi:hypothetical protein